MLWFDAYVFVVVVVGVVVVGCLVVAAAAVVVDDSPVVAAAVVVVDGAVPCRWWRSAVPSCLRSMPFSSSAIFHFLKN